MANRSVNTVVLLGNLGRDAETAFTTGGTPVTKFSVATTRRWKDNASGEWKEDTNWTNVVLWRNEKLGPYLTKGKQVYVQGRLSTRSYDDKEGKKVYATEVIADEVILLGGNGNQQDSGSHDERSPGLPSSRPSVAGGGLDFGQGADDEDLPF